MNPRRETCSAMDAISSCLVCPRTKVFMSPLGHWLLMGRRFHTELWSSTETLGSSNNQSEREVTLAVSPSSISRLSSLSREAGVTCSLSFFFLKRGHQLLPSSLTRPALHRHWCGCGNWRRDRWHSWKKTQRALGLPIYSGQFRACRLNIHSW